MTQYNILIVDDDDDIRHLLKYNLEKEGFITHQASNGIQCLERIQEIKPEIYQCVNVNINLFLLLKIEIIKRILAPPFGSSLVNKKSKEIQIEMLRILEEKQSLNL